MPHDALTRGEVFELAEPNILADKRNKDFME